MSSVRVLLLGLGPIGRSVALSILESPDLKLAAVVDPSPDLAGRTLGEVLGNGKGSRLRVHPSLSKVKAKVDVCAHLAASRYEDAHDQILPVLRKGLPVVSTCEELIAARWRWPRKAGALDKEARERGVAVLPVGVNPGFAMDALPAAITNVCVTIKSVRVARRVDTSKRRSALQVKTGVGITPTEFQDRKRRGAIGHVGLRDSVLFLVNHLPLDVEVEEEKLSAILAPEDVTRGERTVRKGRVLGVRHTVDARDREGKVRVSARLEMQFGHPDPGDEIKVAGDPPLNLRFEGGISGDRATVGSVLTGLRWSRQAPAGLG